MHNCDVEVAMRASRDLQNTQALIFKMIIINFILKYL